MRNDLKDMPNADDICKILKEIVDVLDYPRRIKILNAIPPGSEKTFDELKVATGISTGSLHHHISEMQRAGFVDKVGERPAKYKRTEFLGYLISLILGNKTSIDINGCSMYAKPAYIREGSN